MTCFRAPHSRWRSSRKWHIPSVIALKWKGWLREDVYCLRTEAVQTLRVCVLLFFFVLFFYLLVFCISQSKVELKWVKTLIKCLRTPLAGLITPASNWQVTGMHITHARMHAHTHTCSCSQLVRVIQKIAEKHLRFQQKEDENSNRRVKQEMENKLC